MSEILLKAIEQRVASLMERLEKHGQHDQSSHGNWAHDGGGSSSGGSSSKHSDPLHRKVAQVLDRAVSAFDKSPVGGNDADNEASFANKHVQNAIKHVKSRNYSKARTALQSAIDTYDNAAKMADNTKARKEYNNIGVALSNVQNALETLHEENA